MVFNRMANDARGPGHHVLAVATCGDRVIDLPKPRGHGSDGSRCLSESRSERRKELHGAFWQALSMLLRFNPLPGTFQSFQVGKAPLERYHVLERTASVLPSTHPDSLIKFSSQS